ncbi:unnamed protein product [Lupinus luteus]|uniref:Uncharacterized protein n=1 Tax=Lupinus luteus TaxID=3873 RepID=A0AAV1XYZ7_LUPLU
MARSEHKPGTGIHTASTRQVAQADSLADVLMRPALNQTPGQFDHLKSDFKSKQLVSKHITNNSLKLSGGVCALGDEPSTRPDQQAPGQLNVSTVKVAQAGA